MISKSFSRLWVIALSVSVAFIFAGCAAQLTGQLDADKAKLSELAKMRKDYCPSGEKLFAKAEVLLENATHEIIEEGNHKADAQVMLAEAENLIAKAEKKYAECTPPKHYSAPVGAISMPEKAYAGDEVRIDGSGSTDADNDPLEYVWDFGDGGTGTGQVGDYVFQKEGTYNVTLKVSDILYDGEPVSKSILIEKKLPEIIVLNEINYYDVKFSFNSASLSKEAKKLLDENVQAIKDHPEYRVVVTGHTCSIGSDKYNQKLSENRAESVKKYYADNGTNASIIEAMGKGESEPVASNDTRAGREKNRRVVTTLCLIKK